MLDKETFVKAINFIEERNNACMEINKLFAKEFEDSVFYPYFKYDNMLVEVLAAAMDDQGDWISYFLWGCDYGKAMELGDVTEADGTPIDISTSEKLYDFLIKEKEERNKNN